MSYAGCLARNNEAIDDRERMKDETPFYSPCVILNVQATVSRLDLETKVTISKAVADEKPKKPKKKKRKTKVISCVTCAKTFKFTGGEQKFYEEHKFCDPTHCPECRAIKKQIFKNKEVC